MRYPLSSRRFLAVCVALGLVVGSLRGAAPNALAQEPESPKHTIKEVMKVGHKDGLLKKILDGAGTDEDKQLLLDLYISLVESKPEKGDEDSWYELAGAAAMASAKVVVGREGAIESLKVATNCKACHDVHK